MIGTRRRIAVVATAAAGVCCWLAMTGSSPAQAATCDPTVNPASDYPTAGLVWNSDQAIAANFTAARAAEGCATPMVLPAGYDAMTPQQQMLWLFNSEREARGCRLAGADVRCRARGDMKTASALNAKHFVLGQAFYAPPFLDMHNRMKEALVMLGRLDRAVVRQPLEKIPPADMERVRTASDPNWFAASG